MDLILSPNSEPFIILSSCDSPSWYSKHVITSPKDRLREGLMKAKKKNVVSSRVNQENAGIIVFVVTKSYGKTSVALRPKAKNLSNLLKQLGCGF